MLAAQLARGISTGNRNRAGGGGQGRRRVSTHSQTELLKSVPENAWPLYRSYQVSDAPLLSVFDYIDENIRDAIIWVGGAQAHYAYDPAFTNSVTRSQPPDYLVAIGIPIDDLWIEADDWEIVYQDRIGIIYQPKP